MLIASMHRIAILACSLALAGCITTRPVAMEQRPAIWGQRVQQSGLPNLHRVTPTLWRSALPDAAGFAKADALGIHTIVNLRPAADAAPSPPQATLLHIPVHTWNVSDAQVLAFLRIATDPARQPVLVHCQHGSDRTGVMVAAYRVVVQDWDKEDAIREMQRGGYGFHAIWVNLPGVIRRLDVAAMRRELARPATAPGE